MTIQLKPNPLHQHGTPGSSTSTTGGISVPAPTATAAPEHGSATIHVQPTAAVLCGCCTTKIAEVRGNTLVIRARHHGREHVTTIALVPVQEGG